MDHNPRFLILDADDRPLGAVEEEGGRWIGRDITGKLLFNRANFGGLQQAAKKHGRLVAATYYPEDTYWDGNNHRGVISNLQIGHEALYRTANGRWVRYYASDEFDGPRYWEFVTPEEAREWLLRNKDDDIVERYFGEIEDESGGPERVKPEVPDED